MLQVPPEYIAYAGIGLFGVTIIALPFLAEYRTSRKYRNTTEKIDLTKDPRDVRLRS